jgi:hypothetical protein
MRFYDTTPYVVLGWFPGMCVVNMRKGVICGPFAHITTNSRIERIWVALHLTVDRLGPMIDEG